MCRPSSHQGGDELKRRFLCTNSLTLVDLHASVAFLLEAWLGDEGAGRSVGAFSRPVEKFPLNFRHYYLIENSWTSSVLWM